MLKYIAIGFAAFLAMSNSSFAQPSNQGQSAVCRPDGSVCAKIDSTTTTVTVRVFRFYAPRAGKIKFTFFGSAQCFNVRPPAVDPLAPVNTVVDFTAAIRLSTDTTPVSITMPSAQRYAFRIDRYEDYNSVPVTIALSRVFDTPTTPTVLEARLVIRSNQIRNPANCLILQGQFDALFTPLRS